MLYPAGCLPFSGNLRSARQIKTLCDLKMPPVINA